MPDTPNKPEGEDELEQLRASKHRRDEERHQEIMSVHKEISKSSTAIKWATWTYAIAALAMLAWSVAQFLLG